MCDLCVRSLWYEFTTSPWGHSVVTVWCHRNMRWLHHSEVTVLSQCDVTDARDGHFTMMSQCCHIMMFTMWGNYDVSMISELWHHMCDLFVRSLWYEFSTSTWGHSVITVWCHRYTCWLGSAVTNVPIYISIAVKRVASTCDPGPTFNIHWVGVGLCSLRATLAQH